MCVRCETSTHTRESRTHTQEKKKRRKEEDRRERFFHMCTCGSTRACRARPRNDSLLCAGPGRTHPPSEGPATRSAVEHSLYGVYEHRVRYNNSAAQRAGHTQHRLVSAEVKRRTGEAGAEAELGKIYTMREEREERERARHSQ